MAIAAALDTFMLSSSEFFIIGICKISSRKDARSTIAGKSPTISAYFILAKAKVIYVTPKNSAFYGLPYRQNQDR